MAAEDYMPDDLGLSDVDPEDNDNPNNCAMCGHKERPEGGWCYMFRNEPNDVCFQHTHRKNTLNDWRKAIENLGRQA